MKQIIFIHLAKPPFILHTSLSLCIGFDILVTVRRADVPFPYGLRTPLPQQQFGMLQLYLKELGKIYIALGKDYGYH